MNEFYSPISNLLCQLSLQSLFVYNDLSQMITIIIIIASLLFLSAIIFPINDLNPNIPFLILTSSSFSNFKTRVLKIAIKWILLILATFLQQ
jgi:hypothetical protein